MYAKRIPLRAQKKANRGAGGCGKSKSAAGHASAPGPASASEYHLLTGGLQNGRMLPRSKILPRAYLVRRAHGSAGGLGRLCILKDTVSVLFSVRVCCCDIPPVADVLQTFFVFVCLTLGTSFAEGAKS